MNIEDIKSLVAKAKELKAATLKAALSEQDSGKAETLLLQAESLAMTECYAQLALVRQLRITGQ